MPFIDLNSITNPNNGSNSLPQASDSTNSQAGDNTNPVIPEELTVDTGNIVPLSSDSYNIQPQNIAPGNVSIDIQTEEKSNNPVEPQVSLSNSDTPVTAEAPDIDIVVGTDNTSVIQQPQEMPDTNTPQAMPVDNGLLGVSALVTQPTEGIRESKGPGFEMEIVTPSTDVSEVDINSKLEAIKDLPSLTEIQNETNPRTSSANIDNQLPKLSNVLDENTVGNIPYSNEVPNTVGSNNLERVGSVNLLELLREAIRLQASDVHFSVGYRATLRVDGALKPMQTPILDEATIKNYIQEVVGDMPGINFDELKDLDIAYSLPEGDYRFRVNIFRQQGTLAAAFRLIPRYIRTLEELSLPAIFKDLVEFNQGLILVTGPTGSGKSTTMAALINEINSKQAKHIITIEDPVEYIYPKGTAMVDQRELGKDTDSWVKALRAVLRQDPNVVMVGEMRDLETISAAMTVAETGHLVFATLHTNSASQSIDRIIDVFPEEQQSQIRTQLASVLTAIISQRLIPINGGGRKAVIEFLLATPAVRSAIRDDKVYQIDNMIQTGGELGMRTLERSLVDLVRQGMISTEQAQQYANKPEDILTLLGQRN